MHTIEATKPEPFCIEHVAARAAVPVEARQPGARRQAPEARRLRLFGAAQATDTDLLVLLLSGSVTRRRKLARRLLDEAGSPWRLVRLGRARLQALGVTPSECTRLLGSVELGRRAALHKPRTAHVHSPEDAYHRLAPHLTGILHERFVVLALDAQSRLRFAARVAEGSVDACPVDPREVFAGAVAERASGVVVGHNHPSGDPTPSEQDVALTRRLMQAGSVLGVAVLDHLIVAGSDYVSLAERGIVNGS